MTLPNDARGLPTPEQRVSALEAELAETRATIVEIVLRLADALNLNESQRADLALPLGVEARALDTPLQFTRTSELAAVAWRG